MLSPIILLLKDTNKESKFKKKVSLKNNPTKKTNVRGYVTSDGKVVSSHNRDQHIGKPEEPKAEHIYAQAIRQFEPNEHDKASNRFDEFVYGLGDQMSYMNAEELGQSFDALMDHFGKMVKDGKAPDLAKKFGKLFVDGMSSQQKEDMHKLSTNMFRKLDLDGNEAVHSSLLKALGSENKFVPDHVMTSPAQNASISTLVNKVTKDHSIEMQVDSIEATRVINDSNYGEFNKNLDEHIGKFTNDKKDLSFIQKAKQKNSEMMDHHNIFTSQGKAQSTVMAHFLNQPNAYDTLKKNNSAENFKDFEKMFSIHSRRSNFNTFASTSPNPKEVYKFIKKSKTAQQSISKTKQDNFFGNTYDDILGKQKPNKNKQEINPTNILNNQYTASNNGYGQLLRRGIHAAIGKNFKADKKSYLTPINNEIGNIYKQTSLGKDKLPDEMVKSINEIYDVTQNYLKNENPSFFEERKPANKNKLYRGFFINKQNGSSNVYLANGLLSTSMSKKNATNFAGSKSPDMLGLPINQVSNLFKENNSNLVIGYPHEGYLSDKMYIDDDTFNKFFHENESNLSLVTSYDTRNLMADEAIFAILTDDPLKRIKDKWPDVKFAGGEGEVMIIT